MTKEIHLVGGRGIALIDDEDMGRVSQHRWHGTKAGYAVTRNPNNKGVIYLHRLIFGPTIHQVDHRNQDKLDCRKANLRAAEPRQNSMNCEKRKRNTSGYKGVYWNKKIKAWIAQINNDGKRTYLGRYDDVIEAAKAYDKAARRIYGEFAGTNF